MKRRRKIPTLRRPVSRDVVHAELADLLARVQLGPCEVLWPAHMDKRHRKSTRSYAQVYPYRQPPVFEFAKAVCKLPREHRLALLAHEIGHVIAPDAGEQGADDAAEHALDILIGYDKRWGGRGLQVCVNKAAANPLPPEQRPVRDAKHQAKYEQRMARKDAALRARMAVAGDAARARSVALPVIHDDPDDEIDPDYGDQLGVCPYCGQREWIDVMEYWPLERRFMIGTCCGGAHEEWVREMEHWSPELWQHFMASRAGVPVRSVGGRPELREKLDVSPEDVFLADEEIVLLQTVPMKARVEGLAVQGALTIDELREYVRRYHKHAGEPGPGALWGYAVYNGLPSPIEYDGPPRFNDRKSGRRPLNLRRFPPNLIGVALIGRPASRLTQQKGEAVARVRAGESAEAVGAELKIKPTTGAEPGERVAEVSRVALDHSQPSFVTYKASSLIYERAAEDAKAAGFTKIQTFTLQSETGMSLRYARWKPVATKTGGGQFTRKGRERHVREGELAAAKTRWEKRLA